MNDAAPESTESDTVTAGGAATVGDAHSPATAHDVEPSKVARFCFVRGCSAPSRGGLFCDGHLLSLKAFNGSVGADDGEPDDEDRQPLREEACS